MLTMFDSNLLDGLSLVSIWTTAEPNIGLTCACLPTLRPVVMKCHKYTPRITNAFLQIWKVMRSFSNLGQQSHDYPPSNTQQVLRPGVPRMQTSKPSTRDVTVQSQACRNDTPTISLPPLAHMESSSLREYIYVFTTIDVEASRSSDDSLP